jgi:hypothetical protein
MSVVPSRFANSHTLIVRCSATRQPPRKAGSVKRPGLGHPGSNPTLMQYTHAPHGEVLGRAPSLNVKRCTCRGRASNHAQRRCRSTDVDVPLSTWLSSWGEVSLRSASCVVRGSPPGGRRTRVERSARLAPHHEGEGSTRRAIDEELSGRDPSQVRVADFGEKGTRASPRRRPGGG